MAKGGVKTIGGGGKEGSITSNMPPPKCPYEAYNENMINNLKNKNEQQEVTKV